MGEGCKEWEEGCEGIGHLEDWLAGKRKKNIKQHIDKSRDLELDNEKRSVKLIKQWNLPIDIKDYIKRANAYVQFYNWMYYSRKWSKPGNSPYRNQAIYDAMPDTFRMNYKQMAKKYQKLFEEQNI